MMAWMACVKCQLESIIHVFIMYMVVVVVVVLVWCWWVGGTTIPGRNDGLLTVDGPSSSEKYLRAPV